MTIKHLDPKPGSPIVDSGDLLAFLRARGINVAGDTVVAYGDGSVDVDTAATTSLTAAWTAYDPGSVPPTPTPREALLAELDGVSDLAALKAFVAARVIPAIAPE